MTSIHSGSTSSTSSSSSSNNESLIDSLISMKTEEHNELYDHRQHNDIISSQNENNNIEYNLHHPNDSKVILDDSGEEDNTAEIIATQLKKKIEQDELEKSDNGTNDQSTKTIAKSHRGNNLTNNSGVRTDDNSNFTNSKFVPATARLSSYEKTDFHPIGKLEVPPIEQTVGPTSPKIKKQNTKVRAHSFSGKLHSKTTRNKPRTESTTSSHSTNPLIKLTKSISYRSNENPNNNIEGAIPKSRRRESFDSDTSQASRESQETEEDVWFPMSPQLHTRINGIDFDELEEFSEQQREKIAQYLSSIVVNNNNNSGNFAMNNKGISTSSSTSTSLSVSSAALKYTPRPSAQQQLNSSSSNENNKINKSNIDVDKKKESIPGVSFGNNKIEGESFNEKPFASETGTSEDDIRAYLDERTQLEDGVASYNGMPYTAPDRFSYFSSSSEETVHSTDIPSLVAKGQSFYNLFKGGQPTWWLDCSCPTDDEMRCIAKAFGIHPLTAEDIRMQETREKVELFKSYYFVCFHTFESDKESEDFLEPINVYIVVFRSGVITFHFNPISHPGNVRRRVRQLRDYVDVNSDWICYALIDDITDSFAPVIQSIEYEADAIEDSVFMFRDMDFSLMLQRIGESRRKAMTLMRLLSGKADVIKMFAKRCQDEANGIGPALTSQINIANLQSNSNINMKTNNSRRQFSVNNNSVNPNNISNQQESDINVRFASQPRAEIAMYLGDIQDHLLTMYQNLSAYEKIFSRSHSNYLAQLQVESFNSNNRVTEMLGKVTMIGTMLVPLNVITGLFGMNVRVPGQDGSHLGWWFGILGVLICLGIGGFVLASFWVARVDPPKTLNEAAISGSKSIISNLLPKNLHNRADRIENAHNKRSSRSVASLPSRYSRYQ